MKGNSSMNELEVLLDRRWILKEQDKELYYKMRDSIGEIRKFATDKLGCQVIENSSMIKLEKIPAIPEVFMGIEEFSSKEEYMFLCILLMFLEDRDSGDQFILSQLTEYIVANVPGTPVDWTLYTNRRRLIKVLRYAVSQSMLHITDGSDDVFMEEQDGEVLYESTGASRYFMRNFTRDVSNYVRPEDFNESDWFAMDEDRGIARRHRVYKRLLFSVGMYKDAGAIEDFDYLRNYGRRLADDIEQTFDCRVQIHKGSAFCVTGEDCRMGATFPGNNVLSDIVLLVCTRIRENVIKQQWIMQEDETVLVSMMELEQLIREVRDVSIAGFTKAYREMPESIFMENVVTELKRWTFIREEEQGNQVVIYPTAGKLAGWYPKDFIDKEQRIDE